jgi:hypothetical protein
MGWLGAGGFVVEATSTSYPRQLASSRRPDRTRGYVPVSQPHAWAPRGTLLMLCLSDSVRRRMGACEVSSGMIGACVYP